MLSLQRPSLDLLHSYLDFVEEMRNHGEKVWEGVVPKPDETPSKFVERLLSAESHPDPGLIPETTYWITKSGTAESENKVVGRIALRHALNDNLKEFGGHIGYEIRPSSRRRGFAKEALRLVLHTDKAQTIGQLLLTCAPDNIASNKTILANAGVLKGTAFVEKWQRDTNYYWIDLSRDRVPKQFIREI